MDKNTITPQMYVSTNEAELLKSVFKGNEYLLKVIRNLFYGFVVSDEDKKLIRDTFSGKKELIAAFRRKVYPIFEIDVPDMPVGLLCDYWLDMDKELMGASNNAIYQRMMSKTRAMDMLEKSFALLENPDGEQVDLKYVDSVTDEFRVALLARSLYIRTVGQGLLIVKMISDKADVTPEEQEKINILNSNK